MKTLCLIMLTMLMGVAGCSPHSVDQYAAQGPSLKLETFFTGPLTAHGIVTNRAGEVTERFSVRMQGTWQGDNGRLEEWFTFADGRKQHRIWWLQRLGDGHYSGRADDVLDEATGRSRGFAMNWHYTMNLKLADGDAVNVTFDDWMFLLDEQRLINRATISKFGFRVGEVLLYIEQDAPAPH